jgi:hypothetical protein
LVSARPFESDALEGNMPEVIQIDSDFMPWYYNVTQSVGRGGSNRSDDTMLVQYLLKKAFEVAKYAPAKPARDIDVDGQCGPTTTSYIIAFQRRTNQLHPGAGTTLDCLVDHALGDGKTGSISQRVYTIAALNKSLHDAFSGIFVDPGSATDMPISLKLIMSAIADSQQISAEDIAA